MHYFDDDKICLAVGFIIPCKFWKYVINVSYEHKTKGLSCQTVYKYAKFHKNP